MTDTPAAPRVLIRTEGALGRLTLNRPEAINALDEDMIATITEALVAWRDDSDVQIVLIDGAGERGMCAGGDVRRLHGQITSDHPEQAAEFFRGEYAMNAMIAEYPKPVVALADGITMGGGIGLAGHAAIRVVTERSKLAMPETRIGFTPDVGGTWLLGRAPGRLGEYLGLTGATMNGADAVYAGFADHFVPSDRLDALREALAYRAGQYIEFLLKDGKRRAYSIASAPSLERPLELHIRHLPGGLFTDHVFGAMKERDILRFEGPLGTFFLREESDKPIVLLASGTGFAPVKALVEHLMHLKSTRPVRLYWGGRRPQDLYMDELCQAWTTTLPDFQYVPVISDALPEDNWTGRTGYVHAAVMQDIPDLSGWQVYACGAPVMVDAARSEYVAQCGLPADEFFADSFTTEADLAQE